jgi:hypothetical protein
MTAAIPISATTTPITVMTVNDTSHIGRRTLVYARAAAVGTYLPPG